MQSLSRVHPRATWKESTAAPDHLFCDRSSGVGKSCLRLPLKASKLWCEFKVGDASGEGEQKLVLLPVVVQKSGKSSKFAWDGETLRLVDFGREPSEGRELFDDGFTRIIQITVARFRELFVPRHVQDNYIEYLRWKFVHRLFSSSLQVLATQAMFRAIGIGSSQALSSAAALNWLLKDGLGRLSRCIYTASLGSAFDTNLKRVRFSTSILFSVSIGIELLTPLFPKHFLLLASLANVAKSISLGAYISTGSAIHRSFAVADNLGEVSAKAQLQTVVFDNLGLVLACLLNAVGGKNTRFQTWINLVVYPVFAAVELFSIYQALKHVHLQTLTKTRLEIIIAAWIQSRRVPSPAEVSQEEGVDFLYLKDNGPWPIRIGCVDPTSQTSAFSLPALQRLSSEDSYFICAETVREPWDSKTKKRIVLSLREGAGSSDIIKGMLQACLVRAELASDSLVAAAEWTRVEEECWRRAAADLSALLTELQLGGWATRNVLLSSPEQARYSIVEGG